MTLRVLFLGRLRDAAQGEERSVAAVATVDDLIASFEHALVAALRSGKVRVAVNGVIGATALADGDEVAFLPPVSGGVT